MTSLPLITQCPCGSLYLPKGKVFSTSGLYVNVTVGNSITELNLLHSEDIYLESGEKFVTVTPIVREHIIPTSLSIYHALPISINNVIQVVVKEKLSKAILGTQYIGKYNEATIINSIVVDLHSSIDLYDNAIIIEITSLCDNGSDPCCDKLPSTIDIVGPRLLCVPLEQYYVLPTTTTTTTPEPFTIEFLATPTNQIVNANTKATFSFSAITMYDKDFKYWWEKSTDNGSSWQKASRLLQGKSRKVHTLVVLATLSMNDTKYRVVTVEPKIKYSNAATLFVIQPTTTTTTTTTFNPVTTTLPPCDLQIFGFGFGNTTTTTTTTTTSSPTTSTTTTTTTLAPTTTTTTTTTTNAAFSPMVVVLTNGSYNSALSSYIVPNGASTMKAWAIGFGYRGAGGTAYKTWSVSGGDIVYYTVGVRNSDGPDSQVIYSSTTITGVGSGGNAGGSYIGGDGGANGGDYSVITQGGTTLLRGGAIGGNAAATGCPRLKSNSSIGGLFTALALAGQSISDCGDEVFGYGGFTSSPVGIRNIAGRGGGGWNGSSNNGVSGAVVLYFE